MHIITLRTNFKIQTLFPVLNTLFEISRASTRTGTCSRNVKTPIKYLRFIYI